MLAKAVRAVFTNALKTLPIGYRKELIVKIEKHG